MQARNPWGNNFEWNGAWSDDSPLWAQHPEVAEAIGRKEAADDGLFWMSWADFSAIFDTVQVRRRRAGRRDTGRVARVPPARDESRGRGRGAVARPSPFSRRGAAA